MADELDGLPSVRPDGVEPPREKRKGKRRERPEPEFTPKMTPTELESKHRQFLIVMFGLFFLVLIVMLAFNSQFDFMSGGGI